MCNKRVDISSRPYAPWRARFGNKLAAGQFVTSVEIVPPKGCDPTKMIEGVHALKEAGVDGITTNKPKWLREQLK